MYTIFIIINICSAENIDVYMKWISSIPPLDSAYCHSKVPIQTIPIVCGQRWPRQSDNNDRLIAAMLSPNKRLAISISLSLLSFIYPDSSNEYSTNANNADTMDAKYSLVLYNYRIRDWLNQNI